MRCQTRLWAHCYAYYTSFAVLRLKLQGASSQALYGLSDRDVQLAGDLLEWATNADIQIRIAQRLNQPVAVENAPDDTPMPFDEANPSVVRQMADAVFLRALAFILHHELAHIQLGHIGAEGSLSIEQEYAADRAAAIFMLGWQIDARGTIPDSASGGYRLH